MLWSRVGGLLGAVATGRGVVTRRYAASDRSVSVEIRARGSRIRGARPGQFFLLRFMSRGLWWQAHPVSLSAAPRDGVLRFTLALAGDGSREMAAAAAGTQVVLEGPYGRFTADRAAGRPVLLIGGGIGLAPLLSLLTDCSPDQRPVVVARVGDADAVPHRAEFDALLRARNGRLRRVELAARDEQVDDWLLNVGGDVVCRGSNGDRPWHVALRHPGDPRRVLEIVTLAGGAVATSGAYERGAHVWSPRGELARRAGSCTVVGPRIDLADALATACWAHGEAEPPWLSRVPEYRVLSASPDGVVTSAGFPLVA